MTAPASTCRGCGGPLPAQRGRGRPRVWCSQRCRKAQYSRPCADCGRPLSGSNGPAARASRCVACQARSIESRGAKSRAGLGRVEWTDRDLLDALRACHEMTGLPVTGNAYVAWQAETGAPSAALFGQRLGGWSRACEQAGVPHGKRKRLVYERTTAEQCVEAVAQAARINGRPPTAAEYTAMRRAWPGLGWPSVSLIVLRCGSWMAAVRAAEA